MSSSIASSAQGRKFLLRPSDDLVALKAFRKTLSAALILAGLGRHVRSNFNPHVTLSYGIGRFRNGQSIQSAGPFESSSSSQACSARTGTSCWVGGRSSHDASAVLNLRATRRRLSDAIARLDRRCAGRDCRNGACCWESCQHNRSRLKLTK
jgi:hypothetical protein